jgi:hypothetical protein
MADSAIPTATEEAAARELAEKAGLEYLQPGAVTVDPRALSVLPAGECRRLRAVPLAAVAGSAVVAVADPSEERLSEIRAVAGEATRFVVLTERTLEALLHSRMFAGAPAAAPRPSQPVEPQPLPVEAPTQPAEAPAPHVSTAPAAPPTFAPAPARPQQPLVLDSTFVDAIVTALVPKLQAFVPTPAPAPAVEASAVPEAAAAEPSEAAPASVADLLAHVDESIASWTRVRQALEAIGTELDASRQNLREAKERLSVAHAEGDQHQRRVVALEAELAERRALVEETRLRLREAAEALGEGVMRLEAPTELY